MEDMITIFAVFGGGKKAELVSKKSPECSVFLGS
jgi:hypothetical protein